MDPSLQRHCGIADLPAWQRRMAALQAPEGVLHPSLRQALALPLLTRLERLVRQGRRAVLGLNGPVGAGKSSLCRLLQELAPQLGLRLAVASIDDFYLPWQARCRAMAGNPFGVSRVPPGSHDLPQLNRSLTGWLHGEPWRQPRFDKRLRGGQGDRAGWETQTCDAVLLEGWLIGCRSLDLPQAAPLDPAVAVALRRATPALNAEELAWLPHWDRQLQGYGPIWALLEEIWVLRPGQWSWPRRWRFQAEARARRQLGSRAGRGQDPGDERGWLQPRDLDALVRSSLCSLPPVLYQDPLVPEAGACSGSRVSVVAELDSRRRCRKCVALRQAPAEGVGVLADPAG